MYSIIPKIIMSKMIIIWKGEVDYITWDWILAI